ncbi:lysylphosphatidylglycerol synthase transmembrane domain-containing protein [Sulfurovum sp.]|uniref:lysylphosphatidylglycerol synthase transmembrane domain-containing protein n=1 Tax=Sulfurovum sp. TaxID=1969726 RepID=UPI0025DA77F1|nr:lysylphosphatidylglycerol synthase transmembrane domain-containing protein [Sulfurovum sp.]
MKNKNLFKFLLKFLFSLLALGYVLSHINLKGILTLASDASWPMLLLGLLIFNLSKMVSSVRLNIFFRVLGLDLKEAEALRLYYIGMFYNLFLPGGIGGDGYKIYLLREHRGQGIKDLVSATLLDRISGLSPLLFLGGILFLFSSYAVLYPWLRPLDWLGLVTVIPITWILYKYFFQRFTSVFLSTVSLGMITQLLQLFSAWALLTAIGFDRYMIEALTLFLLSSVAAVLPVSVGGVGVREFVFLYGFTVLGLPADYGVTFSLLFFLVTALSSFTGLFLRHGLERTS